jgi:hypothetical protein
MEPELSPTTNWKELSPTVDKIGRQTDLINYYYMCQSACLTQEKYMEQNTHNHKVYLEKGKGQSLTEDH